MPTTIETRKGLERVFTEPQARVLTDAIASSYEKVVKTSDFNELKGIVTELAQAQKKTEIEIQKLTEGLRQTREELIQKIGQTEDKLGGLSNKLDLTREELGGLSNKVDLTREELGGLSRSVSYAFENEAYRMISGVLKDRYGINLTDKMIRTEIGGKEINILGRAKRNGKDVVIVGEAKLRLDERRKKPDIFEELEEKVLAVKEEYKEEIVRVLVTHYATKGFMAEAEQKEVIVIQSFEW
ncbi:MAG: hypothetical protein V2A53_10520 [bacterium]